jgi:3'(2'), 5'-bisphosphate nucleotidase
MLELAIVAAQYAGEVILCYYRRIDQIELIDDGSLLTLADKATHNAIAAVLQESAIAMVSEQGDDLLIDITRYWLVDPLDGIKDFIATNDEFTVNVSLVHGGRPVSALSLQRH